MPLVSLDRLDNPMWRRILEQTLSQAAWLLPPGSRVLEIGYGDGRITADLIRRLGWSLTGLDIDPEAWRKARAHLESEGLQADLRLVAPDQTWRHQGRYDGVFIKTVLYNARTPDEYASWLDAILSMLAPGGVLVNFENGKANRLTQIYRRLAGRYYTDLCLFDGRIRRLYEERFHPLSFGYYGGLSQFLFPLPALYFPVAALEENLWERHADNAFIASVVGRKRETAH